MQEEKQERPNLRLPDSGTDSEAEIDPFEPLMRTEALREGPYGSFIKRMEQLDLPRNPLDHLMREFGGSAVEISGRPKRMRIIQGKIPDNEAACQLFQGTKKNITIITNAGGTGINLHDTNSRPRFHICVSWPWEVERWVQQFCPHAAPFAVKQAHLSYHFHEEYSS